MQPYDNFPDYDDWVRDYDTPDESINTIIRKNIQRLPQQPLFSLVLLQPSSDWTSASHDVVISIQRQLYPNWELWLTNQTQYQDAPIDDARVRCVSGDDAQAGGAAFNAALRLAEGQFILPLPSDLVLPPEALWELANAINQHPELEILYSDEDVIDDSGHRSEPRFKTGWDPDLALGRDAMGLIVAYATPLLKSLGGMRTDLFTSALALYELSLRAATVSRVCRIHHLPQILCHRRRVTSASQFGDAVKFRKVVKEHLENAGISAQVVPAPHAPAWNWVLRDLPDPVPSVSVVVPIRDRPEFLERCAHSVLHETDYPKLELVVVDNDSSDRTTHALLHRLSKDSKVKILQYSGSFNYSALNNKAAKAVESDIIVLLNNDTATTNAAWLREMVSHAVRPEVGAVGAKLLYANNQVQHAGIVFQPDVGAVHQYRFAHRTDQGPNGELVLTRTVSAVTGACLAIRRSVYFEIGGLDERLAVSYNDVDLCLRLSDHGYRIVWTPAAELFHFEGRSRGYNDTPEKQALAASELSFVRRKWASVLRNDPFRNSNLDFHWDRVTLSPTARYRSYNPS